MNPSNAFIVICVILFGHILSLGVFTSFYFSYRTKDSNLILYIAAKIFQSFAWLFLGLFLANLTLKNAFIPYFLLLIGGGIEAYCLIQLNQKKNLKLKRMLITLVLVGIFLFSLFGHDTKMRISVYSLTIAIIYFYVFIYLTLKQNTSKMKIKVGFIALIFSISNVARSVFTSLSNSDVAIYTEGPIQYFTGFMNVAIAFTFPMFYLVLLKEKDHLELEQYKNELEEKVEIRTQELREGLEREKELGVLKTNFVSMASHEFRTPLAAINATADVIHRYKDKLNNEEIDKRLIKIKEEVNDMTTMLEDILIIGKSESQRLEFNPKKFDIIEKINDIISDFQLSQSEQREILISKPDNGLKVHADPKWIKHIVINLLSNAVKYSESDQPIEVSITNNKNEVIFSFKDYGIGIPEEDLKNLFNPFHRGKNVGNISGTGLGLAVLFRATELHGGTIDVKSKLGEGTIFTITLPQ